MRAVKKEEIEVSKDDQANINQFSKLNTKFHEKYRDISAKRESLNQMDDALVELDLLNDENDLRIRFGDCFIKVDPDTCREYIEKGIKEVKGEASDLEKTMEETQKKMGKLKSTLYGKFGNSIQLEED